MAIDVVSDNQPVMDAYMTFVSIDEHRQVKPVPPFEPRTASEHECFQEGERWKEFRKRLLSGAVPQLPQRWTRRKPTGPLGRATGFVRGLPDALTKGVLRLRNNGSPDRRRHSYVHSVEPVRVDELNFNGTLHDGTVAGWLGRSAEESARRFLDNEPVRLIGLHGLTYLRPARANYGVHVHSMIVHTDPRSVTALVEVYAEEPAGGDMVQTLRALMSYAPLRPCAIADIACADAGERALYAQVVQQLAMQRVSRRTARRCLWPETHGA